MSQPEWENSSEFNPRKIVYATIVVITFIGVFFLLYNFNDILLIFFIAVLMSTAIRPAVNWLSSRRVPKQVAVILIYILGLVLLAIILIAILPMLVQQITEFVSRLPDYYAQMRDSLFLTRNRLLLEVAEQLPPEIGIGSSDVAMVGDSVNPVSQTMPVVNLLLGNLLSIAGVFILTFYWTLERERSIYYLLLWIPLARRDQTREVIFELEDIVGRFLIGQSSLAVVIGVMALLAYSIIGLPYALALAIIAGLMEVIPLIGPLLGAIPAVVVALSASPIQAVWVVLATMIIQTLENYLLVPRVMRQSIGVSPFIILLSLTAFSSVLGFIGAVLAIPFAAILQVLINRYIINDELKVPSGRGQLSVMRYKTQQLAQDIRKQFRENEQGEDVSGKTLEYLESAVVRFDQFLASIEMSVTKK